MPDPTKNRLVNDVSLFFSKSSVTTAEFHKTGSWRFARPLYINKTAPCSEACPCGNDIPKIENFLSGNNVKQAWETIIMENPFPSVCGRVCFHNCEIACNRNEFDNPVGINSIERFIGDTGIAKKFKFNFKRYLLQAYKMLWPWKIDTT